jgi:hypothetical protein
VYSGQSDQSSSSMALASCWNSMLISSSGV